MRKKVTQVFTVGFLWTFLLLSSIANTYADDTNATSSTGTTTATAVSTNATDTNTKTNTTDKSDAETLTNLLDALNGVGDATENKTNTETSTSNTDTANSDADLWKLFDNAESNTNTTAPVTSDTPVTSNEPDLDSLFNKSNQWNDTSAVVDTTNTSDNGNAIIEPVGDNWTTSNNGIQFEPVNGDDVSHPVIVESTHVKTKGGARLTTTGLNEVFIALFSLFVLLGIVWYRAKFQKK